MHFLFSTVVTSSPPLLLTATSNSSIVCRVLPSHPSFAAERPWTTTTTGLCFYNLYANQTYLSPRIGFLLGTSCIAFHPDKFVLATVFDSAAGLRHGLVHTVSLYLVQNIRQICIRSYQSPNTIEFFFSWTLESSPISGETLLDHTTATHREHITDGGPLERALTLARVFNGNCLLHRSKGGKLLMTRRPLS